MKFSASKALSDSFSIFTGKFGPMAAIAAIFYLIPVLVFLYFFAGSFAGFSQMGKDPKAMLAFLGSIAGKLALVYIVYLLIRTVGICAMTIAAGERKALSVADAIREAAGVLLPMLGVYLVLLIGYLVFGLVLALTVGLSFAGMFSGSTAPGAGAGISAVLLVLALCFAMFYLFAKLSMILPVVAIDKVRSPFAAISRSWQITKGSAFKIFLLFVLFAFAAGIINLVIGQLTGGSGMMMTDLSGSAYLIQLIVSAVLSTLISIYVVALIVAIHGQLAGPSATAISETFA